MHATSPTISQPRTGGLRSFGAGLLVSAAVIGAVIVAANVQPIAPSGTANRTDIHSPAWIQAHRAGETGAMTPAERSLLQQRRGETGALGAPGAAAAGQTPAESTLDYWRSYATLVPGVAPSTVLDAMRDQVPAPYVPNATSSVPDSMAYWHSVNLGAAGFVTAPAPYAPVNDPNAYWHSVNLGAAGFVTAPAPYAPVNDPMAYWHSVNLGAAGFVTAPVYSGKIVDPVSPSLPIPGTGSELSQIEADRTDGAGAAGSAGKKAARLISHR
jgi:hypothetical protein